MSTPTEAQFISYGLRKDGLPISVNLVEYYLQEPMHLDYNDEVLQERFFYYFHWYWSEQKFK